MYLNTKSAFIMFTSCSKVEMETENSRGKETVIISQTCIYPLKTKVTYKEKIRDAAASAAQGDRNSFIAFSSEM